MRTRLSLLICLFLCALPTAQATILGDDLAEEEAVPYDHLPRLRLAAEAGFSQWLYFPDTQYTQGGKDFYNDLNKGWSYAVEAAYFFLPRGGAGLTWIWYLSKAEDADVTLYHDGLSHELSERTSFTYVGPTFWSRMRMGRTGMLVGGFGAGYLEVLDTWTDNGTPYRVEAQTFGLSTSVGFDYPVHPQAALGINARFVFATLKEYTFNGKKVSIKNPDDKTYMIYNIPLYRLELSLGLRILAM